MDTEKVWIQVKECFPLIFGESSLSSTNDEVFYQVKTSLEEAKCYEMFRELMWLELCRCIRQIIVPKFWKHFEIAPENETTTEKDSKNSQKQLYESFDIFTIAVEELKTYFNGLKSTIEYLYSKEFSIDMAIKLERFSKLTKILQESLLSQMPLNISDIPFSFYLVSFEVYKKNIELKKTNDIDSANISDVICTGCRIEFENCRCEALLKCIENINIHLLEMDLLDRIAGRSMTKLIEQQIITHIENTCVGIFNISHLKQLEMWLDEIIITWLASTFSNGNKLQPCNEKSLDIIESFKVKLTYLLYETYSRNVIDQFFSVIIDFPDSIPAIDDLKICMEKIDMKQYLLKSLKSILEARILHPGVNTIDILTGYVAAIKSIRYLDNSGIILESVTAPIREYLRKRNDTVRRVVSGFTEEGPTDLSDELAKSELLKESTESSEKDEVSDWENWIPDPFGVESGHLQNANTNRSADIISMIVDIYGSKELFINEYRNLMADRILTNLDFQTDKEIRNLELLKVRFGETMLHSCEVMLKDVADSKRINSHIQSDPNVNRDRIFEINTLIISAQFWPSFNKEYLELPDEIKNEFKKYTKSYEGYKGNRTLNWRTVTGRVHVVIEISDKVLEYTIAPTHAVIIYHFQDKSEWKLEDLSNTMKMPPSVLRRRMGFWQQQGLIKEADTDFFTLIEEHAHKSNLTGMDVSEVTTEEEDIESAMASASDQKEEELQVFWSYIVGMLTNLDSLTLERIHQMLKLFASHGPGVEFTLDELKIFLQRKVREHKLVLSGGVYQLAK